MTTVKKQKPKPNILFIMDDQHRFDYLGSMGADFVSTPNLDKLAANGVRFTNCYTNSPICVPARISLATGMLPSKAGSIDNHSSLLTNATTFYQRLRDDGYRVGVTGKLDLNKPDPYNGRYGDRPIVYKWGFTHPEECEGKMHAGLSAVPRGPYNYFLQERGLLELFHEDYKSRAKQGFVLANHDSVLPTDAFEDAYIGRKAVEWLNGVPDDFPWFYFVSFVGPHDPYDPPVEYADKYRNSVMPQAIADDMQGKPQWIRQRKITDDPQEIDKARRQYCAAIELIDDQVGMILDALERRGMVEHTYIIFVSDHGEMIGDHGLFQKSVAYEPSIRVPLLISGPDIPRGQVSEALVELMDLNPTICDFAGLETQPTIDAKSILPVLKGETPGHRKEIITMENNFRCLRTEEYKLIDNFNDRLELYHMIEDPNELNNIADQETELAKQLKHRLIQRLIGDRPLQ